MELDFNSFDETLNNYQKIYTDLVKKTLKHLSLHFDPYISVTLVDNDYIHNINREYRHIDRPTDVISFASWITIRAGMKCSNQSKWWC